MKKILDRFSVLSDNLKSRNRKSKMGGVFAIVLALAMWGRLGAADRENLPHRFPGWKHCFR